MNFLLYLKCLLNIPKQFAHALKKNLLVGLILCLGFTSQSATAGIIYDKSPDYTGSEILIENYLNQLSDTLPQWFADRFLFESDTIVSGFDLFGNNYSTNLIGYDVLIRIWADLNNEPVSLIYSEYSTISILDSDGTSSRANLSRRYADMNLSFFAEGSTQYWISMTGVSGNVSLASYVSDDDNYMWLGRWGVNPRSECDFCGDMAFRLHGFSAQEVPEPTTFIMIIIGLCLIIFRRNIKDNYYAQLD